MALQIALSSNTRTLPIEIIERILDEVPQSPSTDLSIPQICRLTRYRFYATPNYPWVVQTFPPHLHGGSLREDAYYVDYWTRFQQLRRDINSVQVIWMIPLVPYGNIIRLTNLVGTFVDMFPTSTWTHLHLISFPWDALGNMLFALKVLPVPREQWLRFPVLKRVTVSGQLQPDHTNLLLRAIDRVSTKQTVEFVTEYPVQNGASLYPNHYL
jgi:hypothetical protein